MWSMPPLGWSSGSMRKQAEQAIKKKLGSRMSDQPLTEDSSSVSQNWDNRYAMVESSCS